MPEKPENSALKLLSSRKTLVMATADKNGAPNVSYAPFVHRAPPQTSSRKQSIGPLTHASQEIRCNRRQLFVPLCAAC